MNNEPVAWMELYYGEPNNLAWTDAELKDSGEVYKTVPLYTHPVKKPIMVLDGNRVYPVVKELTDEVMEQVRVAIMGAAYWCADENMPEAYNAIKVCCGQVLGILDKAQEK